MKWMTKYIFRGWGAVLTWGIACGASAELPAWLSTSDIPTLAEPMNVSRLCLINKISCVRPCSWLDFQAIRTLSGIPAFVILFNAR
ncbi:hypothetical protein QMO17_18885, partial [Klebsiella pneumoniae]|nr:hypothetical protein [Klebsiella pneumoniae]